MKTKGARLTTEISLPGRFLVYVPNGEGLGVSRRLEDAERNRLKDILKGIAPSTGGVIVRTAAEGASAEDIERDLVFLQRLWKTIQARAKLATAPRARLPGGRAAAADRPRPLRRRLRRGARRLTSARYKRIVGYLKKTSPHMIERVHRYKDKEPLFEQFGVEQGDRVDARPSRRPALGRLPRLRLRRGVHRHRRQHGRFVGSRSKSSTQRLEDTIVEEQPRGRQGGRPPAAAARHRRDHRHRLHRHGEPEEPRRPSRRRCRTELERDRTKTYVVEISPLGLVEMTRQNVTDGPREIMTRKCPTCAGDGIVVSDATIAIQVERRLRGARGRRGRVARPGVPGRAPPDGRSRSSSAPAAQRLARDRGRDPRAASSSSRPRVTSTRTTSRCSPRAGSTTSQPSDVRSTEGAEVELKLVEIDLHDGTAAVGKLDGIDVVVADAAKLVGKKAKVTIGRVLEGQAFATLVGRRARRRADHVRERGREADPRSRAP